LQITLKAVSRFYQVGEQTVHALDNVDLEINAGDYISIMGPSGSGKSSLLNIVGLLDRPNSGNYFFEDKNVTSLSEKQQAEVRQQKVGFVFQSFHLIPRLTAYQNIELPMLLSGIHPGERKQRVQAALANTDLEDRANHRPEQLSGGQRQRVAIARSTIMQPQILLADEPTGNLDRKSGNDVIELLERLNNNGITLIIVTHDPNLGKRARRKIRMEDGKVFTDSLNSVKT